MEVQPNKSVGSLELGHPIASAISFLQSERQTYPHVKLLFNDQEPLSDDIMLEVTHHGFRLRFDPESQRLKMVDVFDLTKLVLTYSGSTFSGSSVPSTFLLIYQLFGPTYPGQFDHGSRSYLLHYPGVSFVFPIPEKYHSQYSEGTELPLEFPDGTTPVATRMFVYCGSDVRDPQLPAPSGELQYCDESVQVKLGKSLFFTRRGIEIAFGDGVQTLLSKLGPPSKVFYKEEDKMKIHSKGPDDQTELAGTGTVDYFYNYFPLGIDILVDCKQHVAKKFVLHTNFPGNVSFNQYSKCNFCLPVKDDSQISGSTKWGVVEKLLGTAGRPMVRSEGSNANPFGETLFYGYSDVIFEVMKNSHIASVTLFQSTPSVTAFV